MILKSIIIEILNVKYIPGHAPVLQLRVSDEYPVQCSPITGERYLHVRLRVWVPLPQVVVHPEYALHRVHPSFTVRQ